MVLPANSSLPSYHSPMDVEGQTDDRLTRQSSLSSIISLTIISPHSDETNSCSSIPNFEENENSHTPTFPKTQHQVSRNEASNSSAYHSDNLSSLEEPLKPGVLKTQHILSTQADRISSASFFSAYSHMSRDSYHSALSSFEATQQCLEKANPSRSLQDEVGTHKVTANRNNETRVSVTSSESYEPSLAGSQSSLTSYDATAEEVLTAKYNYPRSLPTNCLYGSNFSLASSNYPTRRQLEELKQQYQEYSSDDESDDEPTTPETPMLEVFRGTLSERPFSISSRHGVNLIRNPKTPVLSLTGLFAQSQQIRHSLHVKYPFLTCIKNGNKDCLIAIKRELGILALTLGLMNSGKSLKGLKELLQDPLSEEEQKELRVHCQEALVILEHRLYREIHDEVTEGLNVLQVKNFPIYKGPVSSRGSEKSRNILSQLRITRPTITKPLINSMARTLDGMVKNQETIAKLKQSMSDCCSIGAACVAYTFYSHETKTELGYPHKQQKLRNVLTVGAQKEISKTQTLDCLFF